MPSGPSARRPSGAGGAASADSDSDSTSTELCDEPDRLSDVDSEELTSTSECCAAADGPPAAVNASPAEAATAAPGTKAR